MGTDMALNTKQLKAALDRYDADDAGTGRVVVYNPAASQPGRPQSYPSPQYSLPRRPFSMGTSTLRRPIKKDISQYGLWTCYEPDVPTGLEEYAQEVELTQAQVETLYSMSEEDPAHFIEKKELPRQFQKYIRSRSSAQPIRIPIAYFVNMVSAIAREELLANDEEAGNLLFITGPELDQILMSYKNWSEEDIRAHSSCFPGILIKPGELSNAIQFLPLIPNKPFIALPEYISIVSKLRVKPEAGAGGQETITKSEMPGFVQALFPELKLGTDRITKSEYKARTAQLQPGYNKEEEPTHLVRPETTPQPTAPPRTRFKEPKTHLVLAPVTVETTHPPAIGACGIVFNVSLGSPIGESLHYDLQSQLVARIQYVEVMDEIIVYLQPSIVTIHAKSEAMRQTINPLRRARMIRPRDEFWARVVSSPDFSKFDAASHCISDFHPDIRGMTKKALAYLVSTTLLESVGIAERAEHISFSN